MASFEERAQLYKNESGSFQEYLINLPAEDLKKQSACDEWLVSDVVAHLVGNSEFYASAVTQGLEDKFSPPEGRAQSMNWPSAHQRGCSGQVIHSRHREARRKTAGDVHREG